MTNPTAGNAQAQDDAPEGSFAHAHPAQAELLRALTALYLELAPEIVEDVWSRANAAVTESRREGMLAAAEIAQKQTFGHEPGWSDSFVCGAVYGSGMVSQAIERAAKEVE